MLAILQSRRRYQRRQYQRRQDLRLLRLHPHRLRQSRRLLPPRWQRLSEARRCKMAAISIDFFTPWSSTNSSRGV